MSELTQHTDFSFVFHAQHSFLSYPQPCCSVWRFCFYVRLKERRELPAVLQKERRGTAAIPLG